MSSEPNKRRRFVRSRLSWIALLAILLVARSGRLKIERAQIDSIRIGFNGYYKVGCWAPVEIRLHGGSESVTGRVEVTVPDGDNIPTRVTGPAVLPAGQDVRLLLYVKVGEMFSDVEAALRVGGRVVAEKTLASDGVSAIPLSSAQELILTLGSAAAVEVEQGQTADGEKKTVIVRLTDLSLLPTRWYGYDGVDWLVLAGSEPEVYRRLSTSNAQIVALDEWIRLGGRLLMYVGREADEILAPGAPLAKFAPGTFQEKVPLRQASALENYAETSDPVEAGSAEAGKPSALEVARLADVRGKIEAYEGAQPGDLPLVIRAPRGFGQTVFVTVDLDRPPLKNWTGRKQLFRVLLGRPAAASENAPTNQGAVTNVGYTDLAGQLRNALEKFAGVQLVPFWIVAALILVYILFIGPIDYFVVKRVFKRMEFTWLTFPSIVVVFSTGAYFLAYWLKGDQLHLNRAEVVDFDSESGLVRGTLWEEIFSPQIDAFNLSLAPQLPASGANRQPHTLLSWSGLPGNSFTGMNPRARNPQLFSRAYDFSRNLDALERMPISVWSTKGIMGRWYAGDAESESERSVSSQDASPNVEADLRDTGDKTLSGTLTSHLTVPLSDAALLYDRWMYKLAGVEPGETINVDDHLDRLTIETHLKTPRPIHYEDGTKDLDYTIELMMFFEAAGGKAFWKLSNEYGGFVDLSQHLKCGQAILVGRVKTSAVELLRDGQPLVDPEGQRVTFYRFVFPVQQGDQQK